MPKGNKGEWAEFYAFVKLLAEGKVFGADPDLNVIPSQVYEIKAIPREGLVFYRTSNSIEFYRGKTHEGSYPLPSLVRQAAHLLREIDAGSGTTFDCPNGEQLLLAFHQTVLKAPSQQKTDLTLEISDLRFPSTVKMGFSVKSCIGNPSTLFNASHATKLVYRIDSRNGYDYSNILAFAKQSPSAEQSKAFINQLIDKGHISLSFAWMMDDTCRRNFVLIDSRFPEIYASAALLNYLGKDSRIQAVCDAMEFDDPLNVDIKNFYTKNFTDFLVAASLGMNASKPWDATEEASGGYLVVKKDGTVVCYNTYDRAQFRGYLFRNTKFDTPSGTKFMNKGETVADGEIYIQDGTAYINLNRQIRFIG